MRVRLKREIDDNNIINNIIKVAIDFNLSIPQLLRDCRLRKVVEVRQCLFEYLYSIGINRYQLAEYFNLNYASVHYSVKQSKNNRVYNGSEQIYQKIKSIFECS